MVSKNFLNNALLFLHMLIRYYMRHQNKLVIIPIILIVLSIITILYFYNQTGDIMDKDVTLKGGVTITVYEAADIKDVENKLEEKFKKNVVVTSLAEFGTKKQKGIVVEASDIAAAELMTSLESILNIKLTEENHSIEETGSSLGKSFYAQMLKAILIALLLMAIVIFIMFRNVIPSLAIIISLVSDIIVIIAAIDLLGMKLSAAGISAILFVIGYSVDTNIILTTKVLKRREEGPLNERVASAIKTGLTITATAMAALLVAYSLSSSPILRQMFLIIIIALLADIVMTYLLNGAIICRYLKRKEIQHG